MAITKYDIYQVKAGATVLSGITDSNLAINSAVRGEASGGSAVAQIVSLIGQKPGGSFSTLNVAGALDLLGIIGASIADMSGGLILYAQKHALGGTRASGSVHKSFTATRGIVIPRRLTCEHQGDAVLSADIIIIYDGTNAPIVPAESVALPTASADTGRWTLGPIDVGGVVLGNFRRLEIDFGVNAGTEGAESAIWDTFASIGNYQPVITVRGIDPDWFKTAAAIPLTGLAGTHANTLIHLRKRAAGGTFVADATAEHISITGAGLITIEDALAGQQGGPTETSLMMTTNHDGTNEPLLLDTTAQIT